MVSFRHHPRASVSAPCSLTASAIEWYPLQTMREVSAKRLFILPFWLFLNLSSLPVPVMAGCMPLNECIEFAGTLLNVTGRYSVIKTCLTLLTCFQKGKTVFL
jgi:hypothetical protein